MKRALQRAFLTLAAFCVLGTIGALGVRSAAGAPAEQRPSIAAVGTEMTITTQPLSAIAPGGAFTIPTAALSAVAPGGTFTISTSALSAVAPGGTFTITTAALSANGPQQILR